MRSLHKVFKRFKSFGPVTQWSLVRFVYGFAWYCLVLGAGMGGGAVGGGAETWWSLVMNLDNHAPLHGSMVTQRLAAWQTQTWNHGSCYYIRSNFTHIFVLNF
jgi:hypothetical protein